ncbi:hypothetical protein [Actinoplanes sp. NBRC 101535]|uniref:hypothetical protein n=1 Tax=Actinoplanes sp. NBRC 101535 TaxID=3032196 RepID=UPI00249FA454|nr:hypothetical protein [Actinoplanes sp. NBRC 101535]GLY07883.1 hypothetical protein Acsp01_82620 [Actinoplanes sp. NBRC 101535]
MNASGLYLVVAGLCMALALVSLKNALAPIGEIVRAAAALALVGLAIGASLVFLIAAALAG